MLTIWCTSGDSFEGPLGLVLSLQEGLEVQQGLQPDLLVSLLSIQLDQTGI